MRAVRITGPGERDVLRVEEAAEVHRRMGADRNVGKIVLEVDAG